jgi:Fe-S-cluster containining protein
MPSPCANCTRKCCHEYLVTVTGYDVWTLATGLHMGPEQFLIVVSQIAPSNWAFRLHPAGPAYHIALDKKRSRGKKRACIFLVELPTGVNRCGVYPFRPIVCQGYPAFLRDQVVARREDVLCPIEAWRDSILDLPIWRKQLVRQQVELDIYEMVVARWNAYVRDTVAPASSLLSLAQYYAYLMDVYARLADVRRRAGDAAWDVHCEAWYTSSISTGNPLVLDVPVPSTLAPVLETIGALIQGMARGPALPV